MELWRELEEADIQAGQGSRVQRLFRESSEVMQDYLSEPAYISVSHGKDSVTMLFIYWSLLQQRLVPKVPVFWIRVEPIAAPYCTDVRDRFLADFIGLNYQEIVIHCHEENGVYHASGTLEAGFRQARKIAQTSRYVTGIRADESSHRWLRFMRWGHSTENTCAPLSKWKVEDVFAFCAVNHIPLHPNYAMMGGGRYDRSHLRVASLGGRRGSNFGRSEWEKEYYPDLMNRYFSLD